LRKYFQMFKVFENENSAKKSLKDVKKFLSRFVVAARDLIIPEEEERGEIERTSIELSGFNKESDEFEQRRFVLHCLHSWFCTFTGLKKGLSKKTKKRWYLYLTEYRKNGGNRILRPDEVQRRVSEMNVNWVRNVSVVRRKKRNRVEVFDEEERITKRVKFSSNDEAIDITSDEE